MSVGQEGDRARLLNRPSWLLDGTDTVGWLLDTLYFDTAWLASAGALLSGALPPPVADIVELSEPLRWMLSFIAGHSFAVALWCNCRMVRALIEAVS